MDIKLTDKEKIRVSDADDVYGIMQRILLRDNKIDREKEHFWVVGLNTAGYILNIELVSLGTSNKSLVEPMNVFRIAIHKGALKIILVHNHPSGTIKPSMEDKDTTDRLIQVGKIICIKVEDHLIITPATYLSFNNIGLMDELEKSQRYVPTYQIIDRIRKEEEAIRKEVKKELKDTKEKLTKAIHSLLDKGSSLEEISGMLGIPVEEVKKISKRKPKK